MRTEFRTNIDCCKKFMNYISGLSIQPMLGDRVRVYSDTVLEVWLKVVERRWTMTNGADPVLTCELHLEEGWTIPKLEAVLRS